MRMRKKGYREEVLKQRSDVLVTKPELLKGQWKSSMNCEILHLELGSGKGDFWSLMAKRYPLEGWIGVEKNLDVAAIALRKVNKPAAANCRFIALSAEYLDDWFVPGEIDVLHLNFSDPWPKNAHAKRRLTHPFYLAVYKRLLKAEGKILFKTDNKDLMDYSLVSLADNDFNLVFYDAAYKRVNEEIVSEYEARFEALGLPIFHAIWQVK